ncbi:hypothetical protein AGMMS50256_30610 [Betaproteobacteria bacterium]|nr:hypothetical protein AGMMS50256_30610 [Betaproteobacteria bacterium]
MGILLQKYYGTIKWKAGEVGLGSAANAAERKFYSLDSGRLMGVANFLVAFSVIGRLDGP